MRKYRLQHKEMSLIKKMEALATQMWWVTSFSQWIPDYEMPEKLRQEVAKLVLNWEASRYTLPNWILELRTKVSEFYKSFYGASFNTDEIMITAGAIEAINAILLTIINTPWDEVVLLDPSYASYNNAIEIAGWKLVYCPIEKDLSLDLQKLKDAITPNTKAIIICNPNNPTWWIIEQDKMIEILEHIKWTDICLICDEVYWHFLLEDNLWFDSATVLFEKYKDNLVVINSWSKLFSVTGWRIWYMIANEEIINETLKIHDSLVTCAPSIAQYGVARTIDSIPWLLDDIVKQIRDARDMVLDRLSDMTDYIEFEKPKAGYYIFCKFKYTDNDYDECMKILKEAKVSLVPWSAFWKQWKWYFRICFWRNLGVLKEGLDRLEKYFKSLGK